MVDRRRHQWLQHRNPRSPFRRPCHRHQVFSFLFSIHGSSHSRCPCCRGRSDTASVFRFSRRVGVMEHCRKTVLVLLLLLCCRCTRRVAAAAAVVVVVVVVVVAWSIKMQMWESPRGMLERFPWRLTRTTTRGNTRTVCPS